MKALNIFDKTIVSIILAALAVLCLPSIALSEGILAAGSEASCSEGFPVITGPRATVFGPNGIYVVEEPAAKKAYESPTGGDETPAGPHKVEIEIKNYKWPSVGKNSFTNSMKKPTKPAKKKPNGSQGIGLGILDERMGVYM